MKTVTLGRPIQRKADVLKITSTNATFARSSLPKDSNLLITMSALLFASLKIFFFGPKNQDRAERSWEGCAGAGAGAGLWGHKSPPNFQPQNSLTVQDREPKSQRNPEILPGNGKRTFPILLAAAAASEVLPIKRAGASPAETNPRDTSSGSPRGLRLLSPPTHPGGTSLGSQNSQWGTSRGKPRITKKSELNL